MTTPREGGRRLSSWLGYRGEWEGEVGGSELQFQPSINPLVFVRREEELLAQGLPPKKAKTDEEDGERVEGLNLELPSFSDDQPTEKPPPKKGLCYTGMSLAPPTPL